MRIPKKLISYKLQAPGGFSLIEIIIAVGILLVLSGVGFGAFSSFKKSSDLSSAADIVLNNLIQARSKTLSAEGADWHGVHFETDKIVFYSGASYVEGASGNRETTIASTVEIFSIALNGGGNEALFKKLTGETDNDGTIIIRLKSDTSKTKTIHIRKTGLAVTE